jgi:hypothetical protein
MLAQEWALAARAAGFVGALVMFTWAATCVIVAGRSQPAPEDDNDEHCTIHEHIHGRALPRACLVVLSVSCRIG